MNVLRKLVVRDHLDDDPRPRSNQVHTGWDHDKKNAVPDI
jgi:hypothetical protein